MKSQSLSFHFVPKHLLLLICCFSSSSNTIKFTEAIFTKRPKTGDASPSLPSLERPSLVQKALETNGCIYYFGLGSNMSRTKLENRSVCGTKINIQSMEAAVVPNYRLAFNMRGFPPLEPGMGSLEPTSPTGRDDDTTTTEGTTTTLQQESSSNDAFGSKPLHSYMHNECHGALVKLSAEDYEKVARSEGVSADATNPGYEEIVVTAIPYDTNRPPVQAVALRARPHVRLYQDPCPSVRYMNILKEGAQELGLKPCYQDFLQQHPVQVNSNILRKLAVLNLVWTVLVSYRLKMRFVSRIQSWVLFQVYVPSSANRVSRILSEILTSLILFPGSFMGMFVFAIMHMTGSIPPFMKVMIDQHWHGKS